MQNSKIAFLENPLVRYEILDSEGEFVTSYDASLKERTAGKIDALSLAKDALRYKSSYKLFEVYENGLRKEI